MKVNYIIIALIISTLAKGQDQQHCEREFWFHLDTTDFLKIEVIIGPTINCESLPPKFYQLVNLKKVKIDPTGLLFISQKINQLQKLEELSIIKSKLTSIPSEIGDLKNLRVLSIAWGGQLDSVPETIGLLHNLETLDLSRNNLSSLPESISKLKNLKKLYLLENDFDERERIKIREYLPNCKVKFDY